MKRLIVPAILAALALPALAQSATPIVDQRQVNQQKLHSQATQKGCADKAQNKQSRKTYKEKNDNQKTPKAS